VGDIPSASGKASSLKGSKRLASAGRREKTLPIGRKQLRWPEREHIRPQGRNSLATNKAIEISRQGKKIQDIIRGVLSSASKNGERLPVRQEKREGRFDARSEERQPMTLEGKDCMARTQKTCPCERCRPTKKMWGDRATPTENDKKDLQNNLGLLATRWERGGPSGCSEIRRSEVLADHKKVRNRFRRRIWEEASSSRYKHRAETFEENIILDPALKRGEMSRSSPRTRWGKGGH